MFVGHGVMFINDPLSARGQRPTAGCRPRPTGRSCRPASGAAPRSAATPRSCAASRSARARWSAPARSSRRTCRRTRSSPACRRASSARADARRRGAVRRAARHRAVMIRHRRHRLRLLGTEPGPQLRRSARRARSSRSCDLRAERAALVASALSRRRARRPTSDELLARPDVDAVAIATPVSTHFDWRCGAAGRQARLGREADDATTSSRRSGWSTRPARRGLVLPSTTRSSTPARSARCASWSRAATSATSTTTTRCA